MTDNTVSTVRLHASISGSRRWVMPTTTQIEAHVSNLVLSVSVCESSALDIGPRTPPISLPYVNGTLRTLHVEYAGYIKDLLWASSAEQLRELLDQLEVDDEWWEQWAGQAAPPVDPIGERLALSRVDVGVWMRLLPKVRHFVATALQQFEQHGYAPQLDYAPISIEVVKGLEVELGELASAFRQTVAGMEHNADKSKQEERTLLAFLNGGKALSIGAMSHLLRPAPAVSSGLRGAFHAFIAGLPNAEFLRSKEFAEDGLARVIAIYRNSGAHDSPISGDVCQDCIEVLIGTRRQPGYIARVVEWKL